MRAWYRASRPRPAVGQELCALDTWMRRMLSTKEEIGDETMKFTCSLLIIGLLSGCATTTGRYEREAASVGALTGGVLGGVLGNNLGDGKNQVFGAAIGAATGAWLGQQYGQRQDSIDQRVDVALAAANTIVMNVHNSNGSYTPVRLRVQDGHYIGPRGEVYTTMPTEDQLKQAYGF